MLNALSRAAFGALKAGKSNLTPKIVQNELPKAMVATTSTCEYTRVDGDILCPYRASDALCRAVERALFFFSHYSFGAGKCRSLFFRSFVGVGPVAVHVVHRSTTTPPPPPYSFCGCIDSPRYCRCRS